MTSGMSRSSRCSTIHLLIDKSLRTESQSNPKSVGGGGGAVGILGLTASTGFPSEKLGASHL